MLCKRISAAFYLITVIFIEEENESITNIYAPTCELAGFPKLGGRHSKG